MQKFMIVLRALMLSSSVALAESTLAVSFADGDLADSIHSDLIFVDAYIVVQSTFQSIGGYECSIDIVAGNGIVALAGGPNGWMNFGGSFFNHRVGFVTPIPNTNPWVTLCELLFLLDAGGSGSIHTVESTSLSSVKALFH